MFILLAGLVYSISSSGGLASLLNLCGLALNLSNYLALRVAGHRVRIHFAKHLAENSGLVCPDCGYLLHGLPDNHQCPECGRAYTMIGLRMEWLRWMSKRYPERR